MWTEGMGQLEFLWKVLWGDFWMRCLCGTRTSCNLVVLVGEEVGVRRFLVVLVDEVSWTGGEDELLLVHQNDQVKLTTSSSTKT